MAEDKKINDKPIYAQINRKIWNTDCFRSLSRDARELFQYIMTSPHGNQLGLFVLRPGYAIDDLQWKTDREGYGKPLTELIRVGLIAWDEKREIILDISQVEKHPPEGPNQVKYCIKIINQLPKTKLFIKLSAILKGLDKAYLKPLIDRLDERIAEGIGNPDSDSYPDSDSKKPITTVVETDHLVDNSEAEKELYLNGTGSEEIKTLIEKISALRPEPNFNRQVMIFIETYLPGALRKKYSIKTIIKALTRLIEDIPKRAIPKPKEWMEAIMSEEDAEFRAEDLKAEHHVSKREAMAIIGDIFKLAGTPPQ